MKKNVLRNLDFCLTEGQQHGPASPPQLLTEFKFKVLKFVKEDFSNRRSKSNHLDERLRVGRAGCHSVGCFIPPVVHEGLKFTKKLNKCNIIL